QIVGPPVKIKRNLRLKMSGPDVVVVQKKLREMGLYNGRTDGICGPSTIEAVKMLQAKNGLAVTGIIDKETRKFLDFGE
ncbi:MAG: peptidoglycan-binding domain-containing protein, partial [Bacillota bacterium]